MRPHDENQGLGRLIDIAVELGATAAAVVAAGDISARDDLARLCRQPRCRNYGLSLSCPPNVAGPAYFRMLQDRFTHAVAVKIDVPTGLLFSDERLDVMALLHGVVSGVEQAARSMGAPDAAGFAGGSCKQIFCRDHLSCRALSDGGTCRNPGVARASMSGFGIHVSRLMQAAGWSGGTVTRGGEAEPPAMSWVAGLVLVR